MKVCRVIGVGLVALGIVLLYYGYALTQSPVDKIYKTATGKYTTHTLQHLVGGVAAVLSGGLPAVRQKIDNKSD
jgi:hypothetical protein